jgi:hypothetical protein
MSRIVIVACNQTDPANDGRRLAAIIGYWNTQLGRTIKMTPCIGSFEGKHEIGCAFTFENTQYNMVDDVALDLCKAAEQESVIVVRDFANSYLMHPDGSTTNLPGLRPDWSIAAEPTEEYTRFCDGSMLRLIPRAGDSVGAVPIGR